MAKTTTGVRFAFVVTWVFGFGLWAVSSSPGKNVLLPAEAAALLEFKSAADLRRELGFSPATGLAFCKWVGVQCMGTAVVKVVIEDFNLGGVFAPHTLTRLRQLRVLSLRNSSLTGPIPDLSGLVNLKVLFLGSNYFSGFIPPSVSALHRLKTLDLSGNMLSGPIPASVGGLNRLRCLLLDFNRLNGSIPALNQSGLVIFNVSHNDLAGEIPTTAALSRFDSASFQLNPGLCGEIINRPCNSTPTVASPPLLSQTAELNGGVGFNNEDPPLSRKRSKSTALVIGLSIAVPIAVLVIVLVALFFATRKKQGFLRVTAKPAMETSVTGNAEALVRIAAENDELEEKVKRAQEGKRLQKSGSLVFCAGESQVYTLNQLMRASAELLGRGTMGTTYKAVLDSRLLVTVKRLDSGRLASAAPDTFEAHMDHVGRLRHPNLVPLRAFFQARDEKLLIYDYQPNGSLSSLIYGSKSAKARPLHWTSCLKIAEDAAQGLCYIHQAWRLVHGNIKSSNVLLGQDFEACLTDYCLAALATPAQDEDANSLAYRAPETLRPRYCEPNSKSDVYSFGVMLIELLTGKLPAHHPNLFPGDMIRWIRSVRGDGGGDRQLDMLLEVAVECRMGSPEQRPTMWQVLKMIQQVKDVEFIGDGEAA